MKTEFGCKSRYALQMIIPPRPILSVVQGAALWGITKDFIQARRLKCHYGIVVARPRDKVIQDGISNDFIKKHQFYDQYRKLWYVSDCVKILGAKNEEIGLKQTKSTQTQRASPTSGCSVPIFRSFHKSEPKTIDEAHVMAELSINFEHTNTNSLDVTIEFVFYDTVMQAIAYPTKERYNWESVRVNYESIESNNEVYDTTYAHGNKFDENDDEMIKRVISNSFASNPTDEKEEDIKEDISDNTTNDNKENTRDTTYEFEEINEDDIAMYQNAVYGNNQLLLKKGKKELKKREKREHGFNNAQDIHISNPTDIFDDKEIDYSKNKRSKPKINVNTLRNELNLFDKKYKQLKLKQKTEKDKVAMAEYKQDLKDAENEHKQKMASIKTRHDNCLSQIENVFHESIEQLIQCKLQKDASDKDAKKQCHNKTKVGRKKYKNELKIIKDFYNAYAMQVNNKIKNDNETKYEYAKHLQQVKTNYRGELEIIKDFYNQYAMQIDNKIKNDHETKFEYAKYLQEIKTNYRGELEKIQTEYRQDIDMAREWHTKQLVEMLSEMESQKENCFARNPTDIVECKDEQKEQARMHPGQLEFKRFIEEQIQLDHLYNDLYQRFKDAQYDDIRFLKDFDKELLCDEIGLKTLHARTFLRKIKTFMDEVKVFHQWISDIMTKQQTKGMFDNIKWNKIFGLFENNGIITFESLDRYIKCKKDLEKIIGKDKKINKGICDIIWYEMMKVTDDNRETPFGDNDANDENDENGIGIDYDTAMKMAIQQSINDQSNENGHVVETEGLCGETFIE